MGDATAVLESVKASERELAASVASLEERLNRTPSSDSVSMVVFSGELDRILASFTLATGAAASGMKVTMFFTFWAIAALRNGGPQPASKNLIERMFGWMIPRGAGRLPLSKLNFGGLGRWLLTREMRRKGAPDLASLIGIAGELGVRIRVCEAVMNMLGIKRDELIDYPELDVCGVAAFMEDAGASGMTLFI